MNKDNNFGRLLLLLLLAFGICLGLYYLPDQLFGMKIKKVDLLSDLRIKPESLSMDSLRMQLEQPDRPRITRFALQGYVCRQGSRFVGNAYRGLLCRPYRFETFFCRFKK